MYYFRVITNKIIGIFLIILVIISCKNENKVVQPKQELPIMPVEEIKYLLGNGDAIDFIFHNLPFSVNQTELQSVRTTIAGIGLEPVNSNECQSIGRMFVQVKGDIVMEAEIYYDGADCHYYVFYKDKKPVYANQMRPNALSFYNELMNSVNRK